MGGRRRGARGEKLTLNSNTDTVNMEPGEKRMERLNISVDISGRQVFVIGEDDMAMQAVHALLPCGCSITVISERPYPGLESMVKNGLIRLIREPYRREQILDAGMVFACSEKTVNRDIYAACRCLGIPVFTEGEPAKCDFFLAQEQAEAGTE